MKILILISIIFYFINICASYQNCKGCVEKGQKCYKLSENGEHYTPIGVCQDGFVCAPLTLQQNVSESEYVCRSRVGMFGHCLNDNKVVDDICEVGLICDTETGECLNSRFAAVGEACSAKTDCPYDCTCVSGVCTFEPYNCTQTSNCQYGKYCNPNTNRCEDQMGEGKTCDENYDTCANYLQCDVSSKTCIKMGSLKLGSRCQGELMCSFDDNLYCSNGDICEEYIRTIPQGDCLKSPYDKNVSSDYCDWGRECSCQDSKCYQTGFTPSMAKEGVVPLFECMAKNKCLYVSNPYSKDSCISKHCGSQNCKYYKMAYDAIDEKCSPGNTFADQYCKSSNALSNKFNFSIIFIITITLVIMIL